MERNLEVARFKTNDLAWLVTLAAAWFWTCRQLSATWAAFPNYGFGYCVPWIALLLAWRRISEFPGRFDSPVSATGAERVLLRAAFVLAWALLLFGELVRQIDPLWRMVSWAMMASLTLLTGCWIYRQGGGKFFQQMAFPLAFAWTAIPWPLIFEDAVTLKLRSFVTIATVRALQRIGVTAWNQGNIINLASTSVVVDSACSGITSLQSTLMASLFLGEFFFFRISRRLLLVVAGAGIAMAANLVRATTLVWLANRGGPEAMAKYHDLASYAESAGIFITLGAMSWLLSRKREAGATPKAGEIAGRQEPVSPLHASASRPAGGGNDGFVALVSFGSIPLLAWGWFAAMRSGPVRIQEAPRWKLAVSSMKTAWRVRATTLSKIELRTLDCAEQQTVSFEGPASGEIQHFFWKTNSSAAFAHTPEVCMAGAGWEKKDLPSVVILRVHDAALPCNVYRYTRGPEEVVVFQSVCYGGEPSLSRNDFPYALAAPRASRLALLWNEPQREGLESLNLYLSPSGDRAAETRVAEEILAQVLVPNR